MTTHLQKVMTLIDNNSNNIKEGDYLQICDLLMKVHGSVYTPEYASTQPLPVPFAPRLPVVRTLDFSNSLMNVASNVLEKKKWKRMTEKRKIEVLKKIYWNDNTEGFEPRLSDMENTVSLTKEQLKVLYKNEMEKHNREIDNQINNIIY